MIQLEIHRVVRAKERVVDTEIDRKRGRGGEGVRERGNFRYRGGRALEVYGKEKRKKKIE